MFGSTPPGSKITALVLGWVEDSVDRSDSRDFGVAGSTDSFLYLHRLIPVAALSIKIPLRGRVFGSWQPSVTVPLIQLPLKTWRTISLESERTEIGRLPQ